MLKITLRASGAQAPRDMQTDDRWIVRCDRGEISQRGNKVSAVLSCSVVGRLTDEGFTPDNAGVLLKQWYFLKQINPSTPEIVLDIHPYSKYGTAWALAMGRSFNAGEDPDPRAFEGKLFRADVGFSSAAGGSFSDRNKGKPKDPRDFLRIHAIVEKIEEKTLTHMSHMDHVHVHAFEHRHEHDTRASAVAEASASTEANSKVIRMNSNIGNERVPQGHHANEAPGEDSEKKGVTPRDALRIFTGAKVTSGPVEERYKLLKKANL